MISPRTLRGRLALWYAAVLVVALGAFTMIVYVLDEDEVAETMHGRESAEETRGIVISLLVALPTALAIAVGGGLFITRRALRPLEQIAALASTLQSSSLDRRLEVAPGAPLELSRLAGALNEMLARLDHSVTAMRRFTADASHELRTPLATAIGELELLIRRPRSEEELRAGVGRALEGLARLTKLTDVLLELSRTDAGVVAAPRTKLALAGLASDVLDASHLSVEARGLRLGKQLDAEIEIEGDAVWIESAVMNLVDNACKFSAPGGRIDVSLLREGGDALLVVENDLDGSEDLSWERVFERFYRAPSARGATRGFGLGLALVGEVARRHGGEASLVRTAEGRARATLRLPAL